MIVQKQPVGQMIVFEQVTGFGYVFIIDLQVLVYDACGLDGYPEIAVVTDIREDTHGSIPERVFCLQEEVGLRMNQDDSKYLS